MSNFSYPEPTSEIPGFEIPGLEETSFRELESVPESELELESIKSPVKIPEIIICKICPSKFNEMGFLKTGDDLITHNKLWHNPKYLGRVRTLETSLILTPYFNITFYLYHILTYHYDSTGNFQNWAICGNHCIIF